MDVRLKEGPFGVKLFQRVATNGDVEWFITNHLILNLTREMVIDAVQVRWQAEEFHRCFKQLAGGRKMPMPQRQCPTQPPELLLPGLGVAPPTCPPNKPNDLSGALTAMGALPAAITPKTAHPSACVVVCVSPNVKSPDSAQSLVLTQNSKALPSMLSEGLFRTGGYREYQFLRCFSQRRMALLFPLRSRKKIWVRTRR